MSTLRNVIRYMCRPPHETVTRDLAIVVVLLVGTPFVLVSL